MENWPRTFFFCFSIWACNLVHETFFMKWDVCFLPTSFLRLSYIVVSAAFSLQLLKRSIYSCIYLDIWQVANLLHAKAIKQRRLGAFNPFEQKPEGSSSSTVTKDRRMWSSDQCERHSVARLIIQSSFSSCEMSAAKHCNRRLQSAATHSSWIISYLSWRKSEEDLERNP